MDFASLRASNVRYALVLSLLSGLSCLQHASFARAAVEADDAIGLCQMETLPKDIRSTLERRFNGWTVQDSTNLLPRARRKWASIAPPTCPGIASGHYEDSRSVAYALLLVPETAAPTATSSSSSARRPASPYYGFKMLASGAINASAFFIHSVDDRPGLRWRPEEEIPAQGQRWHRVGVTRRKGAHPKRILLDG